MSLTSHLKDYNSPVSKFLREQFPNTRAVLQPYRNKLKNSTTILPIEDVSYGTIGTAFDYRSRYYFAVTPSEELVAAHTLRWITKSPELFTRQRSTRVKKVWTQKRVGISPQLASAFFSGLSSFLEQTQLVNCTLVQGDEELINRYCYVLALFEQLFRAGPFLNSPLLWEVAQESTVNDLLQLAPQNAIDDLCRLSHCFYDQFGHRLLDRAVLNPTFDGSLEIGGADADLILDGCLLEIKATIRPRLEAIWLHQLIGYALLDYTDQHRVQELGFYMARQQSMQRWPLTEVLHVASNGTDLPVHEWRNRFQVVVGTEHARLVAERKKWIEEQAAREKEAKSARKRKPSKKETTL